MAITNTSLDTYYQEIYHSYGENAVTTIYLCNTSSSTVRVDLHACKANTTPSTSNIIYYQLPIAAGDTYVIDTEKLILERMVHILATDVHNPFRNFVPLSYGLEIARRLIGEDAELLVAQNCDMIVQGKSLF